MHEDWQVDLIKDIHEDWQVNLANDMHDDWQVDLIKDIHEDWQVNFVQRAMQLTNLAQNYMKYSIIEEYLLTWNVIVKAFTIFTSHY